MSHCGDPSEDGSKVAPKCEDIDEEEESDPGACGDGESSGEIEGIEAHVNVTDVPVETITEQPAVVTEEPARTLSEVPTAEPAFVIEPVGIKVPVETDEVKTTEATTTQTPAITET